MTMVQMLMNVSWSLPKNTMSRNLQIPMFDAWTVTSQWHPVYLCNFMSSRAGGWAFACVHTGLICPVLTFLFFSWSLHLAMVIAFSSGWWLCGFYISELFMFLEVCSIAVHLTTSCLFTQRHISLSVLCVYMKPSKQSFFPPRFVAITSIVLLSVTFFLA
jgi:hypothetical protein